MTTPDAAVLLESWRDRAATVDTSGFKATPTGDLDCLFFVWRDQEELVKLMTLEQLGPAAQRAVQEGALTPFAVLGDTEESGEDLTLFNVLDTQFDGILLYDADHVVHTDDDGILTRQDVTIGELAVTVD